MITKEDYYKFLDSVTEPNQSYYFSGSSNILTYKPEPNKAELFVDSRGNKYTMDDLYPICVFFNAFPLQTINLSKQAVNNVPNMEEITEKFNDFVRHMDNYTAQQKAEAYIALYDEVKVALKQQKEEVCIALYNEINAALNSIDETNLTKDQRRTLEYLKELYRTMGPIVYSTRSYENK